MALTTRNATGRTRAESVPIDKQPGHVVLATLGKRVLRPGGLELTRGMLDALAIDSADDVVEVAPGLGATARLVLERKPHSYVGVDADPDWASRVHDELAGLGPAAVTVGDASSTGLDPAAASVFYGEAMLTMHSEDRKRSIIREAHRVLRPGGRYGIHELCLRPDDISEDTAARIRKDLSLSIRVGARPLTVGEWSELVRSEGFEVASVETAPMHLLEPRRVIADEGAARTARFVLKVATNPALRRRVVDMRRTFRRHAANIAAVSIVAERQ